MDNHIYFWKNVFRQVKNKLFSGRMLFVGIITLLFHDLYLRELIDYSIQYKEKIVPVLFPFLMHNLDFELVFSLAAVYLFSDMPYMQRSEMYSIMRVGRRKWCAGKILLLFFMSVIYVLLQYVIDIVRMLPQVAIKNEWDRVVFSVANGVLEYGHGGFFSGLMNRYSPYELFGYSVFMGIMVVFMTAVSMYAICMGLGRKAAILFGCFISVLPIVAQNSKLEWPYIYYLSPVSWIGRIQDRYARFLPNHIYMFIIIGIVVGIDICVIFYKLKKMDYMWIEED